MHHARLSVAKLRSVKTQNKVVLVHVNCKQWNISRLRHYKFMRNGKVLAYVTRHFAFTVQVITALFYLSAF